MRRPTAYLDWSTLSDGFEAARGLAGESSNEYKELPGVIEALSQAGTLFLSLTHICELMLRKPKDTALQMAVWLDGLEPRWICGFNPANDEELRWWADRQRGIEQAPNYSPFAESLLSAMAHWTTPDDLTDIDPTIAGFVRAAHAHPSVPAHRAHAVRCFQRLHADRAANAGQASPPDAESVLAAKFRRLLIDRMHSLALRDSQGRLLAFGSLAKLADQILENEESLPFNRLSSLLTQRLAQDITKQPSSDSKNFRERYASMGYDLLHLLGAAYCDIFTCDFRVDQAIGDFRVRRGRARQLSVIGCDGKKPFVDELARQVFSASLA